MIASRTNGATDAVKASGRLYRGGGDVDGIGSSNGTPYNCIDDRGECQIRVGGGREGIALRPRRIYPMLVLSSFIYLNIALGEKTNHNLVRQVTPTTKPTKVP